MKMPTLSMFDASILGMRTMAMAISKETTIVPVL
jgi:hypothetical protein